MKYDGSGSPIASITLAADHEPLEGDVLELDLAPASPPRVAVASLDASRVLGRIASGLRRSKPGGGLLDQPAARVLADRHQAGLVVGQQHGRGSRAPAPRRRPSARSGRSPRRRPPARRGGSRRRRRGSPRERIGRSGRSVRAVEHLAGVVGAGVVDDDTPRPAGASERGQPVEHAGQQVGAVVGHDDDRDASRSPQEPLVAGEVAAQRRRASRVEAQPQPAGSAG